MSLLIFFVLQLIVHTIIHTGSTHMLNNLSWRHFNPMYHHILPPCCTCYKDRDVLTVLRSSQQSGQAGTFLEVHMLVNSLGRYYF